MKDEIDLSKCTTFREVKQVIDDWMDYYNNERYQWQLAKLSQNPIRLLRKRADHHGTYENQTAETVCAG